MEKVLKIAFKEIFWRQKNPKIFHPKPGPAGPPPPPHPQLCFTYVMVHGLKCLKNAWFSEMPKKYHLPKISS